MRLLYACSELGLGHVSRTTALGKRLEQLGHEIHFYSGGRAYQLLKKEFSNVYPVTPVGWYENASGIVTAASLINILFPLPNYDNEKKWHNEDERRADEAENKIEEALKILDDHSRFEPTELFLERLRGVLEAF